MAMNGFDWFLVVFFLLTAIISVSQTGKRREPITAATAACVVVINLTIIAGLLYSHGAIG